MDIYVPSYVYECPHILLSCHTISDCILESQLIMVTNTEIHFLSVHENHTHTLSKATMQAFETKIARSAFTGGLF